MKTRFASAALAIAFATPAVALEIDLPSDPQLMLGDTIYGVDLTGAHDGDLIVPQGYSEMTDSPFTGQEVHLSDGETRLGTVEVVFGDGNGAMQAAIRVDGDVELAMADAIYVALPEGAESDGSITLNITEDELIGASQDWAD